MPKSRRDVVVFDPLHRLGARAEPTAMELFAGKPRVRRA
jgi:hypothetical protein